MATPNILVVDSDEGFGNMLKEGLSNSGYYQAQWAPTGHDALQSLVTAPFDLVIIDMALTDIPPLHLLYAVRKIKKDMRVMLIPLMGQQISDKVRAVINGVLTKPFFVGDLPDLVDKALGRERVAAPPPIPTAPPAPPTIAAAASRNDLRSKEPAQKVAPTPAPPLQVAAMPSIPQEKIRYLRSNESEILRLLNDLNREIRAEAILLIVGQELISQAGLLSRDQCRELSVLVAQSSQAAALAANFLGEKAGRFGESLHEGKDYRVYTLTLGEGILLSTALSSRVPMGMIRHQCRQIATQISQYI